MAAAAENRRNIARFKREFVEALNEGNAALFVGAGLSVAAGFVDWRTLLRDIANDLGLEVDRESDLLALAQYHYNDRQSRSGINKKLIDEFTKTASLTENHRIIADLPLAAIWTTNYDTLIEDAVKASGRRPDVKVSSSSLDQRMPHRDVIIYKMHGDISDPGNAVLIKDDYETYNDTPTRSVFSALLRADLITKRFLFLGFSFTDPNIEYVLGRIRALLGTNKPEHYCILKRPVQPVGGADRADYEYECRKLELRAQDLKRYGITALLVDDYAEITAILSELRRASMLRNVLVSGAAEHQSWRSHINLGRLSHAVGLALAQSGENLVTGLGIGVGSAVLSGFVAGVFSEGSPIDDRLVVMPFPGQQNGETNGQFTEHRERMVLRCGIVVVLSGNRLRDGEIENSPGVFEEVSIAVNHGRYIIPVAATGSAAEVIAGRVAANPEHYYDDIDVATELAVVTNPESKEPAIIAAVTAMIRKIRKHHALAD